MRAESIDPNIASLPSSEKYGLSHSIQTGVSSSPNILAGPSGALGVSEVSVIERLKYVGLALALVSSVAISTDDSLFRTLMPDRLPIQVSYGVAPSRQVLMRGQSAPSSRELAAEIATEPVEDGMSHPAEKFIAAFAEKHGAAGVRSAIRELGTSRLTADFLRLLGRAARLDGGTRAEILRDALKSSDLEIRDAAVQAAESWNDRALAAILRTHREQVPWFADYLQRVAAELEG